MQKAETIGSKLSARQKLQQKLFQKFHEDNLAQGSTALAPLVNVQTHVRMVADGALHGAHRTLVLKRQRQRQVHSLTLKVLHTTLIATAIARHTICN